MNIVEIYGVCFFIEFFFFFGKLKTGDNNITDADDDSLFGFDSFESRCFRDSDSISFVQSRSDSFSYQFFFLSNLLRKRFSDLTAVF